MNISTTNNVGRYLNMEQDLKQILNSMTSLYCHHTLLNFGPAVCDARGQVTQSGYSVFLAGGTTVQLTITL
uniref:Uncharacterized protein n=1 Tax=Timema cristinae TaxID=61476 RepID=A0A7R9D923_TIMCR|nr:unnamed protein product [Timema cristinae]